MGEVSRDDPLLPEAIKIVNEYDRVATSLLQRKLSIGYGRASKIMEALSGAGILGPGKESQIRVVLKKEIQKESEPGKVMVCHAFIVDILSLRYMLHIWTKPHFSLAWHRKRDGLIGRMFWIQRYN